MRGNPHVRFGEREADPDSTQHQAEEHLNSCARKNSCCAICGVLQNAAGAVKRRHPLVDTKLTWKGNRKGTTACLARQVSRLFFEFMPCPDMYFIRTRLDCLKPRPEA